MALDRINFGMSRKISDGDYGSVDCHFSYSTDVLPDEDLESATRRCIEYVEGVVADKVEELIEKLEDQD